MPYVKLAHQLEERIKVPDAEFLILSLLTASSRALPGPAIVKASNGEISVNSVYTLLTRMVKRGVIERHEEMVEVPDSAPLKRVTYKVREGLEMHQPVLGTGFQP